MGAITKECTVENYKTKEGKLITWQGDVHNDKADCDDRVSDLHKGLASIYGTDVALLKGH